VNQRVNKQILQKTKAFGRYTLLECHFKVNFINLGISARIGVVLPKEKSLFYSAVNLRVKILLKIHCDM
jgi:hypothetical protein